MVGDTAQDVEGKTTQRVQLVVCAVGFLRGEEHRITEVAMLKLQWSSSAHWLPPFVREAAASWKDGSDLLCRLVSGEGGPAGRFRSPFPAPLRPPPSQTGSHVAAVPRSAIIDDVLVMDERDLSQRQRRKTWQ